MDVFQTPKSEQNDPQTAQKHCSVSGYQDTAYGSEDQAGSCR
jgi:hypothetical protein